ncbi:MKI67 FHA domain-interacting nucleolar phosphoprotein [Anopheles coustani]|uniref:MKI67 FHA domain-interacting nucleolar phosphoprotein n=1 Tax=Anopheles coustani TaxID=139045 RepID=UPI00265A36FF|nr:MKI67 FHA domain-interacting nucleolar phosphoprotein [Anopheles coustani]
MAPRKDNQTTIKPTQSGSNTSTGNIVPDQKQTKKPKRIMYGKQPFKSPNSSKGMEESRIIFLQHLPEGFFEQELNSFFSQFGTVTKAFVARSLSSNRSRGYGYVEFEYAGVARIAASAVNNYLMFGKILKASVVPSLNGRRFPRKLAKMMINTSHKNFLKFRNHRVLDNNGFVGDTRRQMRRLRRVAKVQKALGELKQAEVELPDMPQCFAEVTRLVHTNSDSKPEDIKPVNVKKVEEEQNADSSDDEDTFVPLKPSDWVVTEPESIKDDEDTTASQTLVKVEKDEGMKRKAKKTAGGKVQKKTEKKKNFSENAKKSTFKSLRTGTSK